MPHQPSRNKRKERHKKWMYQQGSELKTKNEVTFDMLLWYSCYCKDNGDIVYSLDFQNFVYEKLYEAFGNTIPDFAFEQEPGTVFNCAPTTSFPIAIYTHRTGSLQK